MKKYQRTIDKIITEVNGQYGAPMGRSDIGTRPQDEKIFDCKVPMSSDGAYDKGGAYWGCGAELRVAYTKDLSYVRFYRINDYPEQFPVIIESPFNETWCIRSPSGFSIKGQFETCTKAIQYAQTMNWEIKHVLN